MAMDEFCKRSGQIPAFGNWDYTNELPITQYFESARQAGLLRYNCSGECHLYMKKPSSHAVGVVPPKKARARVNEKKWPQLKEQKRQRGKMGDVRVTEAPRKMLRNPNQQAGNTVNHVGVVKVRAPKPVDEDLYKIPPQLLQNTKRKKMRGLFSRCFTPACIG